MDRSATDDQDYTIHITGGSIVLPGVIRVRDQIGGRHIFQLAPRHDGLARSGTYECRKQFTVKIGTVYEDSHSRAAPMPMVSAKESQWD